MDGLNKLISIEETNKLILSGRTMVIAGSETAIRQLRSGNWIAGTIPYFMSQNGGCHDVEQLFVTDFSDIAQKFKIASYAANQISEIPHDAFANGFTYVLVPGMSDTLQQYALEVERMPNLFNTPIMGWVTGVSLDKLNSEQAKTFNGTTRSQFEKHVVAMHVQLPDEQLAKLEILNLFEQGDGDTIVFQEEGFVCKQCLINGVETNLADYIEANNIDIRFPLVADYSGAKINISFQHVDKVKKEVVFYAPVRENIEYKAAKPLTDYVGEFNKQIPDVDALAACNCILNYVHSELEGQQTGRVTGPFTFGEIAYVLLNQTLVYLNILKK